MRGTFAASEACVKCPRPPDRSPSLNLRLREKRLENQLPPSRRAQALKSPPNRVSYEFSLRALFWAILHPQCLLTSGRINNRGRPAQFHDVAGVPPCDLRAARYWPVGGGVERDRARLQPEHAFAEARHRNPGTPRGRDGRLNSPRPLR